MNGADVWQMVLFLFAAAAADVGGGGVLPSVLTGCMCIFPELCVAWMDVQQQSQACVWVWHTVGPVGVVSAALASGSHSSVSSLLKQV